MVPTTRSIRTISGRLVGHVSSRIHDWVKSRVNSRLHSRIASWFPAHVHSPVHTPIHTPIHTHLRRAAISLLVGFFIALPGHRANAEIFIGQSAPLTGGLANTGNGLVLGTRIVFDQVNAEGGINGQKLVQVVKDDANTAEGMTRNTKAFLADPRVVAVTGYYGTDNVAEQFKQSLFDGSPMAIVGVSSGARLLREPLIPTIFHIRASYAEEIDAIVRHVTGLGSKRIAVFYEDSPFGDAGMRAVEDAAKQRKALVVARASYDERSMDVKNALSDVIASQPETVIMIATSAPAAAFIKAYKAAGGHAYLFGISTLSSAELAKEASPAILQGLGISQVLPFPFSATLPVVSEYQAQMSKYAKGTPYSYSSMEGFINAKVLVAALKKAGRAPTRASVRQALDNLGEVNVGGYPVTFSTYSHVGSRFVDLTVVGRNGSLLR
jgi:branched-chain amino acid transport system substrate-binding protein